MHKYNNNAILLGVENVRLSVLLWQLESNLSEFDIVVEKTLGKIT